MKVAIIDYGAGNTLSVAMALERLNVVPLVTADSAEIRRADKVIFPGVGEASTARKRLDSAGLSEVIPQLKQPFLGICLGMQLLFDSSRENTTPGLGIFNGEAIRFTDPSLKVPHIGWNRITGLSGPLFQDIPEGSYVYFVHSFFLPQGSYTTASTSYDASFSASVTRENFFGTQFHPEKSGSIGAQILKNFLKL